MVLAALAARIDAACRELGLHVRRSSGRPSQVSSSQGSRIVTISAVAPEAMNCVEQLARRASEQRLDGGEAGLGAARLRPVAMFGEDEIAEDDVRDAVARERPERRA